MHAYIQVNPVKNNEKHDKKVGKENPMGNNDLRQEGI
jgi:hypothetical protein